MKPNGLGIVLAVATAVTLLPPAAEAQIDCRIVAVQFSGDSKGGYCEGDTGVCMVFYLECDGQPWPLPPFADATLEAGHVGPAPQLAFLSPSDGAFVAQPLMEAGPNLSLVAYYCESDRLFETLDRRRFPESADQGFQKTERADGPVAPVPALP